MEVGHVSDAKLLTNKPETGMCYTLGRNSCTTVLFQDEAVKTFLDIGAFCSCASTNFWDIIYPEWRHNLLPFPKATFSIWNRTMKPIGVVLLPLIFPQTKGSLRLNVEFVVSADGICEYLILVNDTF